jgi:hypothetical protein
MAASFSPSLDDVMLFQYAMLALDIHVSPESSDVQMFPPFSHAASLVPSLEDVMSHKAIESLDVHVSPESVDVQTSPSQVAAASLVPSLDDVMRHHLS